MSIINKFPTVNEIDFFLSEVSKDEANPRCYICDKEITKVINEDNRIINPYTSGYLIRDDFSLNERNTDKYICLPCMHKYIKLRNYEHDSVEYINYVFNTVLEKDKEEETTDSNDPIINYDSSDDKKENNSHKSFKNKAKDIAEDFEKQLNNIFNKVEDDIVGQSHIDKSNESKDEQSEDSDKKLIDRLVKQTVPIKNESVSFLDMIPAQIKEKLDEYVIGQENTKKILSVAIYNHIKRIKFSKEKKDINVDKSNILIMGPTGSGKTYLIKTVAKILNVPFVSVPLTTFSATGWSGGDLDSIITSVYENNTYQNPEFAIIYFDEADKMIAPQISSGGTNHAQMLQNELLTLLEGSITTNNKSKTMNAGLSSTNHKTKIYDTSNMLFILGGSFAELESKLKKKHESTKIGFNTDLDDKEEHLGTYQYLNHITNEDLIEFGMIPELAGRLPIKCVVDKLDLEMYKKILTEPKNSIIQQYKDLLSVDNVELVVEDSALEAIANKADALGIGARGLRSVLEDIMITAMYEIPNDKTITKVILNDKVINHESDIIYVRYKKE